ncbi:hypothetical protein EXS70_03425 [Candidatus Peribacteria bacterium]|nr:hypothetical protein [Candidatus Peribacteria bacterium]
MSHHPLTNGKTTTMAFGIAAALMALCAHVLTVEARLVETVKTNTNWTTIDEQDVASGATVAAGRHIFFHVPQAQDRIDREVLLGHRGDRVRYWGYCFPERDDPENPPQSVGFPGKLFLSEAERAWRKAQETRMNTFSPLQRPPRIAQHVAKSPVLHQLETFRGGMTCYIMTERELPIGADGDNDGLNSQLEKQEGTDIHMADTDQDGLNDGNEIVMGTRPLIRDSDSDGLIDGVEDTNRNGVLDAGETDPRKLDSDGDGLCDGLCHELKVRRMCKDNKGFQCLDIPYGQVMGEDRNLNGKVDKGENDPRKLDSLGDGIRDDARFYKCLLDGRKDC